MTKGERTKKRITLAARELFSNRGYTCVTMKDICLAADISRGGLYAHFSSTAEILEHIIELEQQQAKKALDDAVLRLNEGVTLDIAAILLEEAIQPLAELVGKSASQAVIEQVFANFCVGK